MTAWTEAQEQKGCAMWRAGKSAAEIAYAICKSRNAVIGRARRMRWGFHQNGTRAGDDLPPPVPHRERQPFNDVKAVLGRVALAESLGLCRAARAANISASQLCRERQKVRVLQAEGRL